MDSQRFLIGLGLVILTIGIMWPILSRIGLGRLPGDIIFECGGMTFYFPLVTCIISSIVLSAGSGWSAGDNHTKCSHGISLSIASALCLWYRRSAQVVSDGPPMFWVQFVGGPY